MSEDETIESVSSDDDKSFYPVNADLQKDIDSIRNPWVGSPYYEDAEQWTHLFWQDTGFFRSMFDQLGRGDVLELACGYGRHAEQAAPLVEHLILVDVISENLGKCKERLARFENVEFRLGSGAAFPGCLDACLDAIYCYDAMVHFSPEIVTSYLKDTARVLRVGGRALFHHSNYAEGKGRNWAGNPHARNFMTGELFGAIAEDCGLRVVNQHIIPWGGIPDLDAITLVERIAK